MSTTLDRLLGLVPQPPKKEDSDKFKPWVWEFIRLGNGHINAYTDVGARKKARFHLLGKRMCKEIATRMGLQPGSYDIRSNKAGIAVCGEVTLHAYNIYIQFSCNFTIGRFMYRSCKGKLDYTGGTNMWMKYEQLGDIEKAVRIFKDTACMP